MTSYYNFARLVSGRISLKMGIM